MIILHSRGENLCAHKWTWSRVIIYSFGTSCVCLLPRSMTASIFIVSQVHDSCLHSEKGHRLFSENRIILVLNKAGGSASESVQETSVCSSAVPTGKQTPPPAGTGSGTVIRETTPSARRAEDQDASESPDTIAAGSSRSPPPEEDVAPDPRKKGGIASSGDDPPDTGGPIGPAESGLPAESAPLPAAPSRERILSATAEQLRLWLKEYERQPLDPTRIDTAQWARAQLRFLENEGEREKRLEESRRKRLQKIEELREILFGAKAKYPWVITLPFAESVSSAALNRELDKLDKALVGVAEKCQREYDERMERVARGSGSDDPRKDRRAVGQSAKEETANNRNGEIDPQRLALLRDPIARSEMFRGKKLGVHEWRPQPSVPGGDDRRIGKYCGMQ